MYDDPIPHESTQYHNPYNSHGQQLPSTRQYGPDGQQQHFGDQELQRLHQHQLLIQLRLEINTLRTQIQQLELLKQQLIHQRSMMQPAEYEQLMDQFSRTTASLFRIGHPSHFGDTPSCQQLTLGSSNSGDCEIRADGGGGGSGGGYAGMHMMEKLQQRLQSMTLQQQQQQQQEYAHRQQRQQLHLQQQVDVIGGRSSEGSPRRDPVRMEQLSLEAELRDLEKRMRSINLLQ
ncbi:hypothetical protein BGZ99_002697 [Dissophora globulifera]|uniref:Uncharacterized protein n=1 Tax=Dissophora globulifera TaxID=979702 RepID=A0A9P6UX46_9FUNG|nr:hypothetical protein BGZ99_002697 [Dissophora globulifera]